MLKFLFTYSCGSQKLHITDFRRWDNSIFDHSLRRIEDENPLKVKNSQYNTKFTDFYKKV